MPLKSEQYQFLNMPGQAQRESEVSKIDSLKLSAIEERFGSEVSSNHVIKELNESDASVSGHSQAIDKDSNVSFRRENSSAVGK